MYAKLSKTHPHHLNTHLAHGDAYSPMQRNVFHRKKQIQTDKLAYLPNLSSNTMVDHRFFFLNLSYGLVNRMKEHAY